MNRVILMGRLTRDPEVRYSQGERSMAIARYSIAVDRRFKREGEPEADFFNCTSFGKQAEFVERYIRKGTKVVLSGRIQNDNYTNREGQMVYSVRIIVDDIEFAESKNASAGGDAANYGDGAGYGGNSYGGSQQSSRPAPSSAIGDGFMNIPDSVDDEGLPFN